MQDPGGRGSYALIGRAGEAAADRMERHATVANVEVVSIVDAVTRDLRERVLSGELGPDHPLAETDVAERYQVARPTAKAAIENLVKERLLDRRAHRTARVIRLTAQDAGDIYLSRCFIEAEVVRQLAAGREVPVAAREANARIAALVDASPLEVVQPDMAFHTSLVEAVGSPRTSRLYASLVSEVVLCMSQIQGASLLSTPAIHAEHERIMVLIERGNADAAAAAIEEHILRARDRLVQRIADGVEGR